MLNAYQKISDQKGRGLSGKEDMRKKMEPYLWMAPAFLIFVVFTFYPFLQTIYKSFFMVDQVGRIRKFVGIENYLYILRDSNFLSSIKVTLMYTILTVPLSKVLAMLLAIMANKKRRLSVVYETCFSMPMAIATSVAAMIFQLMFVPSLGLINNLTGWKVQWLTDARIALLAICIVQIWLSIGYAFLFLLAAIRSIPADVIDSSRLDGAGIWMQVRRIYLPLISPTMFYLICTDIAWSMMAMSLVNVMTAGQYGTMTIMQYVYKQFTAAGNYTNANPASIIAFVLAFLATMLSFAWEKKGVTYQ